MALSLAASSLDAEVGPRDAALTAAGGGGGAAGEAEESGGGGMPPAIEERRNTPSAPGGGDADRPEVEVLGLALGSRGIFDAPDDDGDEEDEAFCCCCCCGALRGLACTAGFDCEPIGAAMIIGRNGEPLTCLPYRVTDTMREADVIWSISIGFSASMEQV
jgi:hypothetical protein